MWKSWINSTYNSEQNTGTCWKEIIFCPLWRQDTNIFETSACGTKFDNNCIVNFLTWVRIRNLFRLNEFKIELAMLICYIFKNSFGVFCGQCYYTVIHNHEWLHPWQMTSFNIWAVWIIEPGTGRGLRNF